YQDHGEEDEDADDAADHRLGGAGLDGRRRHPQHHQQHQRGGDHQRVYRTPPLARPVDVFEVHPEGELADRQPDPDPEQQRADLHPGAVAAAEEADRAGDDHRHDPEHEVVDVDAALAFDVARPPGDRFAADDPRAHADEGEGADQADQD